MKYAAPGLDILATAVLLLDDERVIRHMNPAAENLLGISASLALNRPLGEIIRHCPDLDRAVGDALLRNMSFTEHHLVIETPEHALTLNMTVTPLDYEAGAVVLEFHPAGSSMRIARDEQAMAQAQAVQLLLRQLAHEIRNPLGGIRGAAQLLEAELNGAELSEYTQVIIQETNRMQGLLDRWLTPAKRPEIHAVNVHEILERVRSLLLAEYPGLSVHRDYDISLPEVRGDTEQLIQAVLNIARNAAQAMEGRGDITLRTSVARQVTLAMKRWKLAVRLDVIDNGPGIPEEMQDKVFFPLVSGREGGSGVGLTLAQSLVQRHEGVIHMVSEPGFTCFSIYLPIQGSEVRDQGFAAAPLSLSAET
ncbi:MAG TPA: nitrogen regulation protein NR(II) [Thiobacillaceae bacterium]|nr:nitrogen regulation protein NR(II) [Thiobacillaceae bacterium]